jgi:hypothetical protein
MFYEQADYSDGFGAEIGIQNHHAQMKVSS